MAVQASGRFRLFPARGESGSQLTRGWDLVLLCITGALLILGLIMIYSVSFGPNVQGGKPDPIGLFGRQAAYALLGLALMGIMARLDYHLAERFALPAMGLTVAMLFILLFAGSDARRWFAGGSLQPGEVAKLVTVVYIAAWLASKGAKLRNLIYGLIPFSIIVGLVAGLIAAEPNYSTAILIAVTALAMFFIAGADLIQFGILLMLGGGVAWFVISNSARAMGRVGSFLSDPFAVASTQYWQLREALIALGSGGLVGKGLGVGGGQYGWVPLAHSDTILAIWGEETGLIGSFLIVGLFLLLAHRGFLIAVQAPDNFGRVLASGLTFWIFMQAVINMGVVTQTVPFTGQPLPFISFGGSSMVVSLVGIGLLLSIARGKARAPATARATAPARAQPEKEARAAATVKHATIVNGRWDRRSHLPSTRRKPSRVRSRTRSRPGS